MRGGGRATEAVGSLIELVSGLVVIAPGRWSLCLIARGTAVRAVTGIVGWSRMRSYIVLRQHCDRELRVSSSADADDCDRCV